jgi:hypothetical protein
MKSEKASGVGPSTNTRKAKSNSKVIGLEWL